MENGFPDSLTGEEHTAAWRAAMSRRSAGEGNARAPEMAEATVAERRPFMVVAVRERANARERMVVWMLKHSSDNPPSYTAHVLAAENWDTRPSESRPEGD